MKSVFFSAAFFLFSFGILAQEGQINIEKDSRIDELVKAYTAVHSKSEYYQIQVGFGNYQKALNLKTKIDEDFPNMPSKIEFESPTYRVRVGKFKNRLEAERKYLEVRKKYPNAMLLKPE
ncbi:SPOR domain-containing protein [Allomuricauda sp. d1]|uniref:SPOR domain-containing protein n=1 Tax=Allomuricauda sp. d1 TaxID=3136725 RepID=UPI0031DF4A4C